MNTEQNQLKSLLTETIALLCQRGLTFSKELHIQGLLGITIDGNVFLVPVDERTCKNVQQTTPVSCEPPQIPVQSSISQPRQGAVHHTMSAEPADRKPNISRTCMAEHVSRNSNAECATIQSLPPFSHVAFPLVKKSEIVNVDDDDNYSSDDNDSVAFTVGFDKNATSFRAANLSYPAPSMIQSASSSFLPVVPFGHEPLMAQSVYSNTAFRNSSTAPQLPAGTGDMKVDGKRKRKRSNFGGDMLVLSAENGEWTDTVPRETGVEALVGCSQWFGHDDSFSRDVCSQQYNDDADGSLKPGIYHQRRSSHDIDSKAFRCQYEDCDKSFYRKDHMVRHQRQKHGKPFGIDSQVIYYCYEPDCDKTFFKLGGLRRHMASVHNYGHAPASEANLQASQELT